MSKFNTQPIGGSPAFLAILDLISHSAALDHTVLVVGERGTGKAMAAGRLHFLSPRWEQTFVAVNCAAYDDAALDAYIFGEDISAGLIEQGEDGTLFLDSIESVSLRLQEKLLRLIEDGEFRRVRGDETLTSNIRVIAAAGIDLPAAARAGTFRPDLLDRLSVDVITMPPLRRRMSDIETLANYFARERVKTVGGQSFPGFTPEVIEYLKAQSWPGNVRQLRSVAERAVNEAMLDDNSFAGPVGEVILDPFDAPWRLSAALPEAAPQQEEITPKAQIKDVSVAPSPGAGFHDRVNAFEKAMIVQALEAHDNHQGRAAKSLNLSYHAFRGQLRKHGLRK